MRIIGKSAITLQQNNRANKPFNHITLRIKLYYYYETQKHEIIPSHSFACYVLFY